MLHLRFKSSANSCYNSHKSAWKPLKARGLCRAQFHITLLPVQVLVFFASLFYPPAMSSHTQPHVSSGSCEAAGMSGSAQLIQRNRERPDYRLLPEGEVGLSLVWNCTLTFWESCRKAAASEIREIWYAAVLEPVNQQTGQGCNA